MLARDIIQNFARRGITLTLVGDQISAKPSASLTDEDRHIIKCYRSEILWRLRHPGGDPAAEEYTVNLALGTWTLGDLAERGAREVAQASEWARENLDPESLAAALALRAHDEKYREVAQ